MNDKVKITGKNSVEIRHSESTGVYYQKPNGEIQTDEKIKLVREDNGSISIGIYKTVESLTRHNDMFDRQLLNRSEDAVGVVQTTHILSKNEGDWHIDGVKSDQSKKDGALIKHLVDKALTTGTLNADEMKQIVTAAKDAKNLTASAKVKNHGRDGR